MAQLVKCLPCKHGGHEFGSPALMFQNKKLNKVAPDVTQLSGRETGMSLELNGQPILPADEHQVQ